MIEIEGLLDIVRREVSRQVSRPQRELTGVVTSYDPKTHSIKMKMQPDQDVESGWIPVRTMQSGNDFGFHMPPAIGDPVSIAFHEDDREAGTMMAAFFTDKHKPVQVQAGEFKYVQATKTFIYFDKDGNVTIQGMNTSDGQGGGQDNSKQTVILGKDGSVTATDKSGNAKVFLDGSGNIVTSCQKFTINASSEIDLNCTKVVINGGTAQVETIQGGKGSNDLWVRPNGPSDPSG